MPLSLAAAQERIAVVDFPTAVQHLPSVGLCKRIETQDHDLTIR